MQTKTPKSPARRIVRAAGRVIARTGFSASTLRDMAREAGISDADLKQHFQSKDQLLLAAQQATFEQLHQRFSQRAQQGERGLAPALEALDAMWESVRALRGGAPFIVETLSLSGKPQPVAEQVAAFYQNATDLLEDGIREVFAEGVADLTVPPRRMAVIIRIMLEGLIVELAQVHSQQDLARVDQAYADMRELFERFALSGKALPALDPNSMDPVALPW